jgi:ferredoxin-nitrate reductase
MSVNLIKKRSTCSYCGVGCGILLSKDAQGRLQVEGDPDHPVNKGMLCSKGRNLNYVVENKADRILYPEMRWEKDGNRQRVSWDAAMDRITKVFKTLISKFGPDSVGFYVSGQMLTEEYYVVNKLAKGFIGTNNIDTNSRLCMSSAVVGYKQSLGEDSVPISYNDIELADCFLISGANPAFCHPIIFRRLEAHKAANKDVKIIVVDPRRTQSASTADLHLQIQPGTDVYIHHAIVRWLIENDKIDIDFIQQHTNGFEQLKEEVMQYSLEEVASICKVPLEDIIKASSLIAESKGLISMWAMGLNQSSIGVSKNTSLINISLVTGKIGKPGNGPFSLTGQPNAMGGREVGGLCNLLPAHRNMDNPKHREEVSQFWGVPSIPSIPGLTATQMFEALDQGKLKAIWIICTNPLVSLPNARLVEEALKKAPFVIVQDISHNSNTCEYADVILPAAGWTEKEGTMTNSDRRVSYLSKVSEPPGEAKPDAEVLCDFANRMGYKGFKFESVAQIFNEHAQLTKGTNIDISGLTHERLNLKGSTQWPYPEGSVDGTDRLFTDFKFYTPDGKAKINAPKPENQSEAPTPDFPLILTTGRIRDQWHTMTRTGKVNRLRQHIGESYVEIHPNDALNYGIETNDIVELTSSFGNARLKAKLTEDIKPGVVFVPMHWGKSAGNDLLRANNLTSTRLDPLSKEPDFKYTSVNIKRFIKPKEKIVVIGAGDAAFRFVSTLRAMQSEDDIHVFSDESVPFYNRIMLPEYMFGSKAWKDLQKISDEELEKLNLILHTNNRIKTIDRHRKIVVDAHGVEHSYDKLVLATGGKATVTSAIDMKIPGVFSIRNKKDAERIVEYVKPNDSVVIVGAGLLGVEMAGALLENNVNINIVNRVGRLMNRQLDKIASSIFQEVIEEIGINLFQNDEIETIIQNTDATLTVILKSGYKINCNSVIVAIGSTPNTELIKNSDITLQRGVVVNDFLQTNDSSIYAIGDIAEHNDTLYGISIVAEEQAVVVARHLCGDVSAQFTGSTHLNILKFPKVEICTIGQTVIPRDDKSYEEILFVDKSSRFYKKCIIHNDVMVGAILLGDITEFPEFKDLIKQKIELSEKRKQLLRNGKVVKPVIGRLVCSCNNVGDGNLWEEIDKGVVNFEKLCNATGAGTGCGSCRPEVKAILVARLKSNMVNKPKPASPVIGKLICKCRKVGEGNLMIEIEKNRNIGIDELCELTNAASGCGKCKPEIEAFLLSNK